MFDKNFVLCVDKRKIGAYQHIPQGLQCVCWTHVVFLARCRRFSTVLFLSMKRKDLHYAWHLRKCVRVAAYYRLQKDIINDYERDYRYDWRITTNEKAARGFLTKLIRMKCDGEAMFCIKDIQSVLDASVRRRRVNDIAFFKWAKQTYMECVLPEYDGGGVC